MTTTDPLKQELEKIDEVLDALVSPTTTEAYQALRQFNGTAVRAALARRAVTGGGGGGPPSGTAGGVLGGTFPNPSFAVDMATQAELDAVPFQSAHLVRHVDYVNGNDSRNGLAPGKAMKTLQAAYDDLKTVALANYSTGGAGGTRLGVGRIYLLPGDHDVGTGVAIDYRYPVEIRGFSAGAGYVPTNSAPRIKSSSAAATEFILIGDTNQVTYGTTVKGVTFFPQPANTALTACVRAYSVNYLRVQNCQTISAANVDVPLVAAGLEGSVANDNSWQWITGNVCSGTPLYFGSGGNFNRCLVGWNRVIFGGGATYPMLWLRCDAEGWSVINNNFEGSGSGPHVRLGHVASSPHRAVNSCVFMGNTGETGFADTITYYDVINGGWNHFIGGFCDCPGAVGTWITFAADAYPNMVYGPFDYTGQLDFKFKVVDNSSFPALNVLNGKAGRILYQKSGAAPTFSSSDFNGTPPNGIVGVTHDTGTGEDRLWAVINGAFKPIDHTQTATFTIIGPVIAGSGTSRFLMPTAGVLVGAVASVGSAPIGSSLICDVNKNGSTIYSTQGNRPTIAAGDSATTTMATPNTTAVAAGDYITVDVDQIGSAVAGADLTVQLLYRLA